MESDVLDDIRATIAGVIDPTDAAERMHREISAALDARGVARKHVARVAIREAFADSLDPARTAEVLRAEIAGTLATISGEGIIVREGTRGGDMLDVRPIPAGGALLRERWAVADRSLDTWYPTMRAARGALAAIANEHGRPLSPDGLGVDLTARGCAESWAEVVERPCAQ